MACEKKFWEDPYLKTLSTILTGVQGNLITLKETILFAFSGGQQSDSGTINGLAVLEAKKEGKEIYYRVPTEHGLKVGDLVQVKIDWDKRYKLMKLHFAAELVLAHRRLCKGALWWNPYQTDRRNWSCSI